MEIVAGCDSIQFYLHSAAISGSVRRSVVIFIGFMKFADRISGFIAVGWQSYLSWLNHRAAKEELLKRNLHTIEE